MKRWPRRGLVLISAIRTLSGRMPIASAALRPAFDRSSNVLHNRKLADGGRCAAHHGPEGVEHRRKLLRTSQLERKDPLGGLFWWSGNRTIAREGPETSV